MPSKSDEIRKKARESLLEIVEVMTGMPGELYEIGLGSNEAVLSIQGIEGFEDYCRFIRSLPGGEENCQLDHSRRVELALKEDSEQQTTCWAGLHNLALPIHLDEEVRAVVLYGQMRIDDDELRIQSDEAQARAAQLLSLSDQQKRMLSDKKALVKEFGKNAVPSVQEVIPPLERWLVSLLDEEDKLKEQVARIVHEVQTRLQAIMANAENLKNRVRAFEDERVEKGAQAVLFNAEAMSSGIQILGSFMQEYKFKSQPLLPLVYEAREIYEAEALGRFIRLQITMEGVDGGHMPSCEISRPHLQHAINNLVHNAVKYSFIGARNRIRYVEIGGYGDQDRDGYWLTFENYGVGILPDEIQGGLLLKDKYQGLLTSSEYRSGAGMGLGFVNDVIKRHGGEIRITSQQTTSSPNPEGQPHVNLFEVFIPYKQKQGGDDREDTNRMDRR